MLDCQVFTFQLSASILSLFPTQTYATDAYMFLFANSCLFAHTQLLLHRDRKDEYRSHDHRDHHTPHSASWYTKGGKSQKQSGGPGGPGFCRPNQRRKVAKRLSQSMLGDYALPCTQLPWTNKFRDTWSRTKACLSGTLVGHTVAEGESQIYQQAAQLIT